MLTREPEQLFVPIPDPTGGGTHRIACLQWGSPAAARTILCVHGLTRNSRDFDYLAHALTQDPDCRVLAPDMPGRGHSDWHKDATHYSYPAYASDITHLLAHLGVTQLQWVGTSMGGIIGATFAAMQPGRVTALVLNDVGALVSGAGLKRILTYAGARPQFATAAEAQDAMRRVFAPFGITHEAHWQHLFNHSIRPLDGGLFTLAYDPAIVAARPKAEDVTDIDLSALFAASAAIPTLLIRGAESDLLTADTARSMARPNLTLHQVQGAGHAPALMDDADTALIRDWLKLQVNNPSAQ